MLRENSPQLYRRARPMPDLSMPELSIGKMASAARRRGYDRMNAQRSPL
ncbi:hypothetical protein ACSBPU_14270 [Parapusillimonas sp. JC17]